MPPPASDVSPAPSRGRGLGSHGAQSTAKPFALIAGRCARSRSSRGRPASAGGERDGDARRRVLIRSAMVGRSGTPDTAPRSSMTGLGSPTLGARHGCAGAGGRRPAGGRDLRRAHRSPRRAGGMLARVGSRGLALVDPSRPPGAIAGSRCLLASRSIRRVPSRASRGWWSSSSRQPGLLIDDAVRVCALATRVSRDRSLSTM